MIIHWYICSTIVFDKLPETEILTFSWHIYTCALYFTTKFYTHIRRIRCVLQNKTLRLDETFLLFVGTSSKENEMKMYLTLLYTLYNIRAILQAVVTIVNMYSVRHSSVFSVYVCRYIIYCEVSPLITKRQLKRFQTFITQFKLSALKSVDMPKRDGKVELFAVEFINMYLPIYWLIFFM